jgi:hypothetical protein
MPVRNGEQYIESAVHSILRQIYTDFEFVIVDDGSTDQTPKILERLSKEDPRIRVVLNTGPHGIANALNLGLQLCVGDYVARHDADDIAFDSRLVKQVEFLDQNVDIAIVGSLIELMDASGEYLRVHGEPITPAAVAFQSLFGTPFAHPSVMFRRHSLSEASLVYQEVPAQDYDLWVRMLESGLRGANLPEVLMRYRVFPSSDSHARATEHACIADEIARNRLSRVVEEGKYPPILEEARCKQIAHALICGVTEGFQPGDEPYGDAILELSESISSLAGVRDDELLDLREMLCVRWLPIRAKLSMISLLARNPRPFARAMSIAGRYFSMQSSVTDKGGFIRKVPIIINTRDRVTELKLLVEWLREAGHERIIIVDNASTYPPLCDYLESFKGQVVRHSKNLGHTALWQTPQLAELIQKEWFVYTDPDVIPDEKCPRDAVAHFYELLLRYKCYEKAGFGLRVDDLPDHYSMKGKVIEWESGLYQRELGPGAFAADIDTTFALYRPGTGYCYGPAIRTRGLYEARHMPWYADSQQLTEESQYYRSHALGGISTWGVDSSWATANVGRKDEGGVNA